MMLRREFAVSVDFFERYAGVVTAETERGRGCSRDLARNRFVRRAVEVAVLVLFKIVDCRGNYAAAYRFDCDDRFKCARCAEHVTRHRLGRAHVDLCGIAFAERLLYCGGLGSVVERH